MKLAMLVMRNGANSIKTQIMDRIYKISFRQHKQCFHTDTGLREVSKINKRMDTINQNKSKMGISKVMDTATVKIRDNKENPIRD